MAEQNMSSVSTTQSPRSGASRYRKLGLFFFALSFGHLRRSTSLLLYAQADGSQYFGSAQRLLCFCVGIGLFTLYVCRSRCRYIDVLAFLPLGGAIVISLIGYGIELIDDRSMDVSRDGEPAAIFASMFLILSFVLTQFVLERRELRPNREVKTAGLE